MYKAAVSIPILGCFLLPGLALGQDARLGFATPPSQIEARIQQAFAPESSAVPALNFVDAQEALDQYDQKTLTCVALDPQVVSRLVRKVAAEEGIDPDLADAVAWVESRYGANNGPSSTGALGIMQLMPETAREMGIGDRCNPEDNIRAGIAYLKKLYVRFKDPLLMLAAYNAGPARVSEKKGIPVYRETAEYIVKVLNRWKFKTMNEPSEPSEPQSVALVKQEKEPDAANAPGKWKDGHVIELQ
jgi:soluble lytic murein transglycosylase-like protein